MYWIEKFFGVKADETADKIDFAEIAEYEAGFREYYNSALKEIYAQAVAKRKHYLALLNQRIRDSALIFAVTFAMMLAFIYSPLRIYYENVGYAFNHLMSSYSHWWGHLPKWAQMLLPSKMIIWSFPQPLTLEILVVILLIYRVVRVLFSYRHSLKGEVMPSIFKFAGNFNYSEDNNNIRNVEFYNNLILPAYDECLLDEACVKTAYKGTSIEIVESTLLLFDPDSSYKPKTPIFSGLLIYVDLGGMVNIKGKHIFGALPPRWFRESAMHEQLTKVDISDDKNLAEYMAIYSSDPQELKSLHSEQLAKMTYYIAQMVNKYNYNDELFSFDDRIFRFFRRLRQLNVESECTRLLQFSINDSKLFIMIPFNHEIFAYRSLLADSHNHEDIHMLLASLYLTVSLVDHLIDNS